MGGYKTKLIPHPAKNWEVTLEHGGADLELAAFRVELLRGALHGLLLVNLNVLFLFSLLGIDRALDSQCPNHLHRL